MPVRQWLGGVIVAVMWMLSASTSDGQVVCGPDSPVERVYADLRFLRPAPLDSNQMFGDLGTQELIELTRQPDKSRWYLDAWREQAPSDLTGLTLNTLRRAPGFRLRKLGWEFNRRGDPVVRPETLGGRERCAASFLFAAVRVWRVRVIAEPRGSAPQVPIDCPACDPGAKTDFTTRWIPDGDSISMDALFGRECKVKMAVKQADLPLTFDLPRLYTMLGPCGGLFGIARFRPNLPAGGISIQIVPPQ